ncbi:MAG: DUF6468 domain-containing protein [Kiloniellaceae bacterium]
MTGAETLGMALDGLVAALLVATIVSAVVLNRKLASLRGAKAEMEGLIGQLVEATEAAQGGLASLRAHAQESGERLQRTLDATRGATDELSYLLERAGAASRDLDKTIAARRERTPAHGGRPTAPVPAREARKKAGGGPAKARRDPSSAQESALLKALQGVR